MKKIYSSVLLAVTLSVKIMVNTRLWQRLLPRGQMAPR